MTKSAEKKAMRALEIYADGLDASVDGRGYGYKHETARQEIIRAFTLLDEALEACRLFVAWASSGIKGMPDEEKLLKAVEKAQSCLRLGNN